MYGSIYMITNLITGKRYVGQTTGSIQNRFNIHCKEKRNRHISNAIRSYKKENFIVEELFCAFSKEALNDFETFFVNHFNTLYPNGYNHRAGGNQNGICSEELKRKISKSKLGKPNLKRRGEARPDNYRLAISRTLGGEQIIAVHMKTNEIKIYPTVNSTKLDGHNPSNVVSICKKYGRRHHSKGWNFYYMSEYANQNGSTENKNSEHVQRIELEPTFKVE